MNPNATGKEEAPPARIEQMHLRQPIMVDAAPATQLARY
jgi:hypothetical protein